MKTYYLIAFAVLLFSACTKDRMYTLPPGAVTNIPGDNTPTKKPLVINELMSSNSGTYQNPQYPGAYPDWFEIYNPNDFPVDLAGMYVTDNLSNFKFHRIASGFSATIIPAKGYKVFCADDSLRQGPLHVAFKLSSSGEALGLADTAGNPVDSIRFGALNVDVSFGRLPNGTGTFSITGLPTPGATNQ